MSGAVARRRLSRTALLLLIGTALLFLIPGTCFACSCVVPPDPATALEEAHAVFEGELLSVKQERYDDGLLRTIMLRDANLFEVNRTWKGAEETQIVVYDNGGGASCGIDFQEGETYLVYVYLNQDGQPYTSLCSRTRAIAHAGEDLAALGPGSEPEKRVDLTKELQRWSLEGYEFEVIVGLIAASAAVLGVWGIAGRRPRK